jgi:enamine deaminase RidA (YjgF/YER057c/UK114 family)
MAQRQVSGGTAMTREQNLADAGLELPPPAAPAANYVPYVVSGNHIYVSGQLPLRNGALVAMGRVGEHVDIEQATEAAQACGLNILAQVKAACGGDLSRVQQVVKLGAFVASTPDFTGQPQVVNGASDLMALVFGDAGKHARFAVGTNVLPLNATVEIDAIVALHP